MTLFKRRVDRIIKRLKRNEAFNGVRFVREYDSQLAETPVRGHLAVVGIEKTSREKCYLGGYLNSKVKGMTCSATVEIKVYAPASENGSGLSELVSEMMEALDKADKEKLITNAQARSIEFDPDMNAIFRRLSFDIKFSEGMED